MTRKLCRFSPQGYHDRIFCLAKNEEELTVQYCRACGTIRVAVRLNKINQSLETLTTTLHRDLDRLIKELPA